MKKPTKIRNFPTVSKPKPKRIGIQLEGTDGKPLPEPLNDTDRLLILQAIQFNNIGASADQFAKMFQTDAETIKADIEHLKQLQQRVRLRMFEIKGTPAS